jgi:hypothetical protein
MSLPLAEILAVEANTEASIIALLDSCLPAPTTGAKLIYPKRSARTADTPRLEVMVITGEAQKDHEHVFQNKQSVYDSWQCELQIKVATNRTSDQNSPTHSALLGRVRAKLQRAVAVAEWNQAATVLLVDIRELGTIDSFDDGDNLDFSVLSWFLFIQINPDAWPVNL